MPHWCYAGVTFVPKTTLYYSAGSGARSCAGLQTCTAGLLTGCCAGARPEPAEGSMPAPIGGDYEFMRSEHSRKQKGRGHRARTLLRSPPRSAL